MSRGERFEPVTIRGVVVKRETEKAMLCVIDGEDYWIPQSQILDDSEVWAAGDEGDLRLPRWLCEEKGIG